MGIAGSKGAIVWVVQDERVDRGYEMGSFSVEVSAEGERNWCGLRLLGGSVRGDDPMGCVMGIVLYRV